jgi:hypothetical protein
VDSFVPGITFLQQVLELIKVAAGTWEMELCPDSIFMGARHARKQAKLSNTLLA